MRPPRSIPSCVVSKRVECIFEKMKMVVDYDIEEKPITDLNFQSQPTYQVSYHRQTQANPRSRRPAKTSLYDFLPAAF